MFHNLRGYDGHLLISAAKEQHGKIRVIPTNMERYLAFSIGQLQFLDSFQFTMKSLDDLVSTLDLDDFKYTNQVFTSEEQLHLMKEKGVFPYDFFDDMSKITSENEMDFPSRSTFFNKLGDKECTIKVSFLYLSYHFSTFTLQG